MQVYVRLLALLLLALLPALAQAQTAEIEQAEAALARGDADALTLLSADRVDVALNGTTTTYSRAQVRYVLAKFLSTHPPESFTFQHRMASGEGAEFASGRYQTAGQVYQVMARFGHRNGGWELRELRIDG